MQAFKHPCAVSLRPVERTLIPVREIKTPIATCEGCGGPHPLVPPSINVESKRRTCVSEMGVYLSRATAIRVAPHATLNRGGHGGMLRRLKVDGRFYFPHRSSHCTCYGSPFPVRDGNEMDTSLSDPCHSPLINFSEPSHKSLRTILEPARRSLKNLPIVSRSLFQIVS